MSDKMTRDVVDAAFFVEMLAEMLAVVAVKLAIPKHHVTEMVSAFYDRERDNGRKPR